MEKYQKSFGYLANKTGLMKELTTRASTNLNVWSSYPSTKDMENYLRSALSDIEIGVSVSDFPSIILNEDTTVLCTSADAIGHMFYFSSLVYESVLVLSKFRDALNEIMSSYSVHVDREHLGVLSAYHELYKVLDVVSAPAVELDSEEEKSAMVQNIVRLANFIPVLCVYLRNKGGVSGLPKREKSESLHGVMFSLLSYLIRLMYDIFQSLSKASVNLEKLPTVLDDAGKMFMLRGKAPLFAFGLMFSGDSDITGVIEHIVVAARSKRKAATQSSKEKRQASILEVLEDIVIDISNVISMRLSSSDNKEKDDSEQPDNKDGEQEPNDDTEETDSDEPEEEESVENTEKEYRQLVFDYARYNKVESGTNEG